MHATTQLPSEISATVEKLLNLPPEQRLQIGERLLASVDVESAWARVAGERAKEMKSGKVKGVSIDDAFEKARRAVDAIRTDAS